MHRLFWLLGALGLPFSHYWLLARVEPFYSSIYIFLWWSYIFVADFLVFKLRGTSMLRDRRWEFAVIWIWSIPLWLLFEMVNLRIQNWYYVMAPASISVGLCYLVFAFGAVLPGIFVTMELIVGMVEKWWPGGKIAGPPFAVTKKHVAIQMAIGAAMLALVFAFPESCFSMAWGFAFFFVDPLLYWLQRRHGNHVGRSLLGQLAAGDNTRFVALLVGGLICGGLWEGWNLGARTKWIYSVPFFDELKLGEMPLLGFLGFPPFALECYALVHLLSYFRGGRNWEFSAEENRQLPGMTRRRVAVCALVLPVAIVASGLAMMPTVASFAEPLTWHFRTELGSGGVRILREMNATQAHEFLKLPERPPHMDAALWTRMGRVARMSELKGMGLPKAMALEALGITTLEELALHEPDELAAKVTHLRERTRAPEAKVWIMAARRELLRQSKLTGVTVPQPL